MIFQCHTQINGTDPRRSPQGVYQEILSQKRFSFSSRFGMVELWFDALLIYLIIVAAPRCLCIGCTLIKLKCVPPFRWLTYEHCLVLFMIDMARRKAKITFFHFGKPGNPGKP